MIKHEENSGDVDKPEQSQNKKKLNGLNVFLITTASLVVLISLFTLATHAYIFSRHFAQANRDVDFSIVDIGRGQRGGGEGGRMMHGFGPLTDDDSDRISGVVISTGTDSFVIAGHGKQYTVKTDSDTNYNVSDKKVSVNDSALVFGDLSDTTITASDIRVLKN